jgi:plastocyanin
MQRLRTTVVLGVLAASLAVVSAAPAATKTVMMGLPPSAAKAFNDRLQVDVNDYFPHKVVINAGDSVRFVPRGFHTMDLPGTGEGPVPLFSPNGQTIGGATDAAGVPFWFNGQPQLGFSPPLLESAFGKTVTHKAGTRVQSGLPLQNRPKPFVVRFGEPGRYTYVCDIHTGMKGVVVVRPSTKAVPSARADRRKVAAQVARDLAVARQLPKATPPAGVVDLGEAGPHGVEYFGMLPERIQVPVGGTVRFRMTQGSYEVHTATFGPGNPLEDPNSYLGMLASSFESPVLEGAAAYPSDPPGSPVTLSPTTHGNGFWNSGVLDAARSTPVPEDGSLQFGTAGDFDYYCLVPPCMRGTVVVR